MPAKLTQDAVIIWATIDPYGTMALFTALTARLASEERRRTAFKAVVYAGALPLGSIVIGQVILGAIGIRLVSLQLAGGVILFLFGLQMIFGSGTRSSRAEPERDIAVSPPAIPATATPGAILAVILRRSRLSEHWGMDCRQEHVRAGSRTLV